MTKTDFDNIPTELKDLPQWVCVRNGSKIPLRADGGGCASSSDPDTWCGYDIAKSAVERGAYDSLGFVFRDNGIVGIDCDIGFGEDGFLSETAIDLMRTCRSYTELSRSGRGIHIYLKGNLPFKGKNNRAGVEIYKSARYFIVTGEKLIYGDLSENQAAIDAVLRKYFSDSEESERESESENTPGNKVDRARIYSPRYAVPKDGKIAVRPTYPPIPQGARNISLASLAGQMHRYGYEKSIIYKELLHVNKTACTPPLPADEVRTILRSVTKYRR